MKIVLKVILIVCVLLIVIGYSFDTIFNVIGKKYIGFGVVIFAFILMPLFVYQRYKGRISDFIDNRIEQEPHQDKN